VQIRVLATAFHIDVRNKTDQTIKLLWDETSFIDLDGTSSRVMHIGVKFEGQIGSQPPTVIPAQQRLADDLFPTNRVWYRTPTPQLTAGYQNGPLLMPAYAATVAHAREPVPAAPDSFTTTVRSHVGKRFAIAILFDADGAQHEYTFWFRVDDATVEAVARPRRADLQNPCKLFSSLTAVVRRAANCTP
jgi:hypothetical protein